MKKINVIVFSALLFFSNGCFAENLKVSPLWSSSGGGTVRDTDLQLTPAFYKNLFITTDSKGYIYANEQQSGKQAWKIKTNVGLTTGVAVNDHAMVVGTHDARILAFHPTTHKLLWTHNLSNQVLASPVLYDDKVVVKTIDGHLIVYQATTGKRVWRYERGSENEILLHTSSAPQVAKGIVVAGFNDGILMALHLNDGRLLWQNSVASAKGFSQIDQVVDITATPIIRDDTVYVATYQGNIKAIGLRSGTPFWSHKLSTYRDLSIDEKNIYASDEEGVVWAFNRTHGGVVWRQPALSGSKLSGPSSVSNFVIVGDATGKLHYLSKSDGHIIRSERLSRSAISIAPRVNGKTMYSVNVLGSINKFQIA